MLLAVSDDVENFHMTVSIPAPKLKEPCCKYSTNLGLLYLSVVLYSKHFSLLPNYKPIIF